MARSVKQRRAHFPALVCAVQDRTHSGLIPLLNTHANARRYGPPNDGVTLHVGHALPRGELGVVLIQLALVFGATFEAIPLMKLWRWFAALRAVHRGLFLLLGCDTQGGHKSTLVEIVRHAAEKPFVDSGQEVPDR